MICIELNFKVFGSTFLISLALALMAFALFPGGDLMLLAKLIALALGITLLSPLWYPHIRGIKSGDRVLICSPSPFIGIKSRYGIAQEDGRKGGEIKVATEEGEELSCEIVSYAGTFSKAKVRVRDDAQLIEVK